MHIRNKDLYWVTEKDGIPYIESTSLWDLLQTIDYLEFKDLKEMAIYTTQKEAKERLNYLLKKLGQQKI